MSRVLIVLLLFVLSLAEANACSCIMSEPEFTVEDFLQYQDIFEGKVVSKALDDQGANETYVLEVSKVYRGERTATKSVVTSVYGGSCGYQLTVGKSYRLFVYYGHIGSCSPQTPLDDEGDEFLANLSEQDSLILHVKGERQTMSPRQAIRYFERIDSLQMDFLERCLATGDGRITSYFLDGSKSGSARIKDGKAHGKAKFYGPDRRLRDKGQFRNGLRHGRWQEFENTRESAADEFGEWALCGRYRDGDRTGVWTVKLVEGTFPAGARFRDGDKVIYLDGYPELVDSTSRD